MKLPRFWGGIKTQTRILFPNIFYLIWNGLGIKEPFLVCLVFSLQNVWFKAKQSVITKDDDASKKCLRACVTVSRQLFSVSSLRTYWREAFFLFTKLFSTQNLIPQSALKFWPLEKLKTFHPQKSFLSVIRKPSYLEESEGNWKNFFFFMQYSIQRLIFAPFHACWRLAKRLLWQSKKRWHNKLLVPTANQKYHSLLWQQNIGQDLVFCILRTCKKNIWFAKK